MFDFALAVDLVDVGIGALAALVGIQFYPPLANVGKWIVEQAKAGFNNINR